VAKKRQMFALLNAPAPHCPSALRNLCALKATLERQCATCASPVLSWWLADNGGINLVEFSGIDPFKFSAGAKCANVLQLVWAVADLHDALICVWPSPICYFIEHNQLLLVGAGIAQAVYGKPFRPDLDLACLLQMLDASSLSAQTFANVEALATFLGPRPFAPMNNKKSIEARINQWTMQWCSLSLFDRAEELCKKHLSKLELTSGVCRILEARDRSQQVALIFLSSDSLEPVANVTNVPDSSATINNESSSNELVSMLAAAIVRQVSNERPSPKNTISTGSTNVHAQKLSQVFAFMESAARDSNNASLQETFRLLCLQNLFGKPCVGLARGMREWIWKICLTGLDSETLYHKYQLGLLHTIDNVDLSLVRQIKQDLARCHPYHPLVQESQEVLLRILLTWAASKPGREYWQGLDSMAAVLFLGMQGDEEAICAALEFCTENLWSGMFVADNSAALLRQTSQFVGLLTFLDSELANHLSKKGVVPDQYVVPWLLTGFAHVFPLDDLVRLWDAFLLQAIPDIAIFACMVLIQIRLVLLSLDDFGNITSFLSRLPVSSSELVDWGVQLSLEALDMFPFLQGVEWDGECCSLYPTDDLLANTLVVDVRSKAEYLTGPVVPGAIHFEISSKMLRDNWSVVLRALLAERDAKSFRIVALYGPHAPELCKKMVENNTRFCCLLKLVL